MYVQSILDRKGAEIVTTRPEETIAATARLLSEHRIGAVLVLDGSGHVAGVISERDIVSGMAKHGAGVAAMTVADLMTRDVLLCRPTDTIEEITAIMTARRVRHLPVLEDDQLVGIVSIGDVVKQRLDETALEVDSLRQYVLAGR
ncbi:CBS domain-containing protein [Rhodospirillaceae bacterium SYSU D60014]|uniref:CBS domain-containing protein n=1 Tax=Virgifigura deserti TaxID=2268457 RepID=UPI000E667F4D